MGSAFNLVFRPEKVLKGKEAIRQFCYRTTQLYATRKGFVRLSLNDFAGVHVSAPDALNANEARLEEIPDLMTAFTLDLLSHL